MIYKQLVGQDAVEYLKQGRKNLTDHDEIISLLESIEEARELNSALLEKKKKKKDFKNKNNDRNNNNNNTDQSNGGNNTNNNNGCVKNKCRMHETHSWFDCPDNPRNKVLIETIIVVSIIIIMVVAEKLM